MPPLIDLDALVRAAGTVEPLPATATRLASIVADSDSRIDEIEETISLDPALTARLLRVANSSSTGSRGSITTVRAAVVRLGTGSVLSLAVGSMVKRRTLRAIPEYGLEEGDLWRHSVAAALATESAARYCGVRVPPESFTAALLHDFGKLLLSRFVDPALLSGTREAMDRGASRLEAEREILGVHHAEVGGLIAQRWGLPDCIVKGIAYHHDPEEYHPAGDEVSTICWLTYLANIAARRVEPALDLDVAPEEGIARARDRLGLGSGGFDSLCQDVASRLEEVSSRYA